ncbi:MAG: radical SAM family heme chaperone HemW [Paludibacter sp.]
MAGIYIHIPFCKKRCTYCDFYTEVAPKLIPRLVDSICKEIEIRANYLAQNQIDTIYFGGGTPSVLKPEQFSAIFKAIYATFSVRENAEITFESNPDDLSVQFFESIRQLPFNRISIGIQSFDDDDLKRINRRHNGNQAVQAIKNAQYAGFKNISIDLIYGLPYQTIEKWEKQLNMALSMNVQHISSYGLTYEEGTKLWEQREKGEVIPVDDDTMNEMYLLLVKNMKEKGFDAYEISNFAQKDYRSRHNSAYWKQQPYLGLGPSAHSYNLVSRQWNVSSILKYVFAVENKTDFFETENLSISEKFNDYVMVTLRTSEGIDLEYIKFEFGEEFVTECLENSQPFLDSLHLNLSDNRLGLTSKGVLISNQILIELMKV